MVVADIGSWCKCGHEHYVAAYEPDQHYSSKHGHDPGVHEHDCSRLTMLFIYM